MATVLQRNLRTSVLSFLSVIAGGLLVVHGLGHGLLAYRGSDMLSDAAPRAALGAACLMAILGFVTAGLSLAGVRSLAGHWRPWLALGLFASLGAFALAWTPELWFGLLVDALVSGLLFVSPRGAGASRGERSRSILRQVSAVTRVEDNRRNALS